MGNMNHPGREREVVKVTLVGTVVNLFLVVLKFIAGIIGRSSAMTADAIHSLSDFLTDIIVLVFVRISGRPQDKDHAYGHGKFETLATLIIGVVLFAVGIKIWVDAVRLIAASLNGSILPRPGFIALVVAVASILSKEILYRFTVRAGRRIESKAVIANAWHHRSDAFSSIGTLIGISGAMFLGERWRVLDPLAALIVSALILKVAWDIVKPCIDELLERSLPASVEYEITELILGVGGVRRMHRLRTRRIGNNIAIEAHIKMDGSLTLFEAHAIASEAERRLREKYGPDTHIGLHMEPA